MTHWNVPPGPSDISQAVLWLRQANEQGLVKWDPSTKQGFDTKMSLAVVVARARVLSETGHPRPEAFDPLERAMSDAQRREGSAGIVALVIPYKDGVFSSAVPIDRETSMSNDPKLWETFGRFVGEEWRRTRDEMDRRSN